MLEDRRYRAVLSDPDPETATRIGWIVAALLFLLAAVSFAGELLGWWNELGELGMTVGTLGGLVVAVATYQHGADRSQVKGIHEAVEDNGETLSSLDGKADLQLGKLAQLDELDRIQLELDKQTGVLEDIRDLL